MVIFFLKSGTISSRTISLPLDLAMARRVGLTTVISRFSPQEGFAPPPSTPTTSLVPDFTDGEQTSINKVKESEARYGEKTKKQQQQQQQSPKTMKTKKKKMLKPKTTMRTKKNKSKPSTIVKSPRKKALALAQVIKGHKGVAVSKSTTLRNLIRKVWWAKKPLLELLRTSFRLVGDGDFLNKKTTLLSLMRNVPFAKQPLVNLLGNKIA